MFQILGPKLPNKFADLEFLCKLAVDLGLRFFKACAKMEEAPFNLSSWKDAWITFDEQINAHQKT